MLSTLLLQHHGQVVAHSTPLPSVSPPPLDACWAKQQSPRPFDGPCAIKRVVLVRSLQLAAKSHRDGPKSKHFRSVASSIGAIDIRAATIEVIVL